MLQEMLKKIDSIEVVGMFNSATEARNYIKKNSIDILFLDIETVPEEENFKLLDEEKRRGNVSIHAPAGGATDEYTIATVTTHSFNPRACGRRDFGSVGF